MFLAIYLIVLFIGVAMTVREGLWSNAITLISILLSGLVAYGWYMPLTILLDEQFDGKYTYVLDYVVIWGLFVAAMVIFRTLTRTASKTRLRFKNPIDPVGGPLVGLLAAWVLAAFVMATLHTSPMPKDAFGGGLVKSTDVDSASRLTKPDAAWLRFMERISAPDALGSSSTKPYSAKGWVKIYEERRTRFDKASSVLVNRG
jgi:hypothetical protein